MRIFVKCFFDEEWDIYRKILWGFSMFSMGILGGILIAPIKKGISIENNVFSKNDVDGSKDSRKKQKPNKHISKDRKKK